MYRLAFSAHFKKQFKKLSSADQERTVRVLENFMESVQKSSLTAGYGFKKINGDKYELRADIRTRIAMKLDGDTLVCHVVGDHETIRGYLRDYRNK